MAGSWEAMAREEGKIWGPQEVGASLKLNFTRGFLVLLRVAPVWQHTRIMNQILTPHLCVCSSVHKCSMNGNSCEVSRFSSPTSEPRGTLSVK